MNIHDIVVADAIEFIGRHAGFDVLLDHFQHIGGESSGNAHFLDVVGRFDAYIHKAAISVSKVGELASCRVIWGAIVNHALLARDARSGAFSCEKL